MKTEDFPYQSFRSEYYVCVKRWFTLCSAQKCAKVRQNHFLPALSSRFFYGAEQSQKKQQGDYFELGHNCHFIHFCHQSGSFHSINQLFMMCKLIYFDMVAIPIII